MSVIYGRAFIRRLVEAGVVPPDTRRVVIDADIRGTVVLHVETLGTEALLTVDPADLRGATVTVAGGDPT